MDHFVRLGRSVRLTDAGERVVAAAHRVLREMADLELGFTDLATGAHGLTRLDLMRQWTLAILPPGSPDDGVALAAMPLVVTPVGTSMRRLLDRALARVGSEPNIAVEVHNREAIIPLVLAGAGVSLVPEMAAADAARRGAVVRALEPAVTRRIGVIHRQGALSPAAEAFLVVGRAWSDAPPRTILNLLVDNGAAARYVVLNQSVENSESRKGDDRMADDQLSRVFAALADPTRRDIVARLSVSDATVGELADPYDVSMQAVSKHIKVLADAGLVTQTRDAQRRPCHLEAEVFSLMTKWIERYRQQAQERYERLDAVLAEMRGDEQQPPQPSTQQGSAS